MRTCMNVALCISAATLLLAGCGGSQSPIGMPGAMQHSSAIAMHADGGSWMLPEAKSENLLYVTNYSDVVVYTYPQGKLVGVLKGFGSTVGDCVDSKGDVFVTNTLHLGRIPADRIVEYAHGGNKPISELKTEHVGPVGCAIDPTTGDLAVTGFGEPPTINIFKSAQGEPILYKDKDFAYTQFCTYDESGNLFVNGLENFTGTPELAELPKGSSKFVKMILNAAINGGAGVQWDGKHLAIGASVATGSTYTPVVHRFSISGGQGTLVGTTMLGPPADITTFQFFIQNDTLIMPNWYFVSSMEKKDVLFYGYPKGGLPTATLTGKVMDPRGVVVSLASER